MPDFTEKTDDYLIEYAFKTIDEFMFDDVDVDINKDWSVVSNLVEIDMGGSCIVCGYKPEQLQTEISDKQLELEEKIYSHTREAITQDMITHMYTNGCLSELLKDVFKQRRDQRKDVKKSMQKDMVKDLLALLQQQDDDEVDLEDLLKDKLADL